MSQGEGVGFQVLVDLKADPAKIRADLRALAPAQQPRPAPPIVAPRVSRSSIGLTRSPRVLRLMGRTQSLAAKDGSPEIDIPDVLLALAGDPENTPLLFELGIDAAAVREMLLRRREPGTSSDDTQG